MQTRQFLRGWYVLAYCGFLVGGLWAQEDERRLGTLAELKRWLPKSDSWEQWLEKTGELPPRFDQIRSIPGLPDPLLDSLGHRIQTPADWLTRRQELLKLFQHYVLGTIPAPPDNL
ncbi:MAG TPA: hypothetical protein PK256_25905, partial [Verrucomicrobiota bacterium]|nr:hypothetical protein [Verrucomicrobiota bacterium]